MCMFRDLICPRGQTPGKAAWAGISVFYEGSAKEGHNLFLQNAIERPPDIRLPDMFGRPALGHWADPELFRARQEAVFSASQTV